MTGYEPDWQGTVKTILDGGEVRRDLLLWNIGIHLARHPIYLLSYARDGDAKRLAPSEMSAGSGWESRYTGIRFQRWEWRKPITLKEQELHSVNGGCPSCFGTEKQRRAGQGITQKEQFDLRSERVAACKDPQIRTFVDVETVRWTEVARFLKPALTEERVAVLDEFMKRRYAHTEAWKPWHYKQDDPDWREKQQEQTRTWCALEDEGHRLAREVWDAALAVEVGKRIGVLF